MEPSAAAGCLSGMRLPLALLLAVVACGTSPAPRAAAPTTPPVRALPSGALAPGTYATARTRRSFTLDVPTDAEGVWTADADTADGFTLRAASAAMGVLAFPRGATTPAALLHAFRTTPGLVKSADEVTKPVDGNDAWHLTWNTTRDTRVTVGGRTFAFAKGERNHAIVVSAPNAPVLVLMAATNADFRTVYDQGHRVVFSMRIGP
jgi:hypothetical protein